MAKAPPPKRRPTPAPASSSVAVDLEPIESPRRPQGNGTGQIAGDKSRNAEELRQREILAAVSGLNLEGVSSTIAATQAEVSRSLAELSAKLVDRVQELQNVEKAINLKREELTTLYGQEAAMLDKDDLLAQIEAQREEWEEEQARKKREAEVERSERAKQWAREEEEYEYTLKQDRKKAEDAFAYKMAEQQRANKDKQEQLTKDWAEREAELKKREQELVDLRNQVAGIPELVKKAVNADVAVATNSVKKEYETKLVLASKDAETDKRLAAQEVAALKQTIEKLTTQCVELKAQVDQAQRDMKEINTEALRSASGRATTEALRSIMVEKEQSSKPSK
jgi:hypothetical protein